jgi:hypothetical protein
MKKYKIIFLTFAIIAIVGGGLLFISLQKSNQSPAIKKTTSKSFKPVNACDLLTVELAKSVIKGEVESNDTESPDVNLANENVVLSNCTYISKEGMTLKDIKTVGLVVRQAKNDAGRESNKFGFEKNKKREYGDISKELQELKKLGITPKESSPVEEIDILGQKAYFDPDLKQFNVLIKDNNFWVMVSGNNIDKNDLLSLTEKIIKQIN